MSSFWSPTERVNFVRSLVRQSPSGPSGPSILLLLRGKVSSRRPVHNEISRRSHWGRTIRLRLKLKSALFAQDVSKIKIGSKIRHCTGQFEIKFEVQHWTPHFLVRTGWAKVEVQHWKLQILGRKGWSCSRGPSSQGPAFIDLEGWSRLLQLFYRSRGKDAI